MEPLKPIADYRTLIESALVYAGATYEYEDVVAEVEAGQAQFWPGPASCIVTSVDVQPRRKILHFFLAAGNQIELEAMVPGVLAWGREEGCTSARFMGRKGWRRSFLARTGWTESEHIIMERDIT